MQPSGSGSSISLTLNLENTRGFETFMKALEDERVRRGLDEVRADLPSGVAQITTMIDDDQMTALATQAAQRWFSMLEGITPLEEVERSGQQLHDYLTNTYPEGLELLADYGRKAFPEYARLSTQRPWDVRASVSTDTAAIVYTAIAANAGVAVNAVVYTNVAAATQVAVSIVAVAVVAVVASSSGRSRLIPESR